MTEPAPFPVRVRRLRLRDFRNHADLALSFGDGPVVLIGENGAGKTNVLEALSLLTPGRGLRRARLADLVRAGAPGFALSADVDGPYGETVIGIGADASDGGRRTRINGEPQRGSDGLSDHLRLLWLVPAMDGLFTGSAGDRRRFLDRLVLAVDPAHGRRVSAYEGAVTARNRLLEERNADPLWLDAIEVEIAATGVAVAAARRETVGCLARLIAAREGESTFPATVLALEGDVDRALDGASAADVEDWLRIDLKAARSRDRAAGRTLCGPHRSDLLVRHAVRDMPAALCSTGEQKALLIGLVLAEAALVAELSGLRPLLLFDEIAAHLDAPRRAGLYDLLEKSGAQTFMTGTDAAPFAALGERGQFITLDGGGSGAER